jgi:CheY-like chemotaxis protein
LSTAFSDGDYEVTAVNNGAKAVQKLAEMRPDIILSDIIMPEKNGYEVCEYVKSHPEFRNIPVVLLTGTFEPFDPDRAEKAGCDAVVTKPFESQSLIHKVEELSNGRSQASTAQTAVVKAPTTGPTESPFATAPPSRRLRHRHRHPRPPPGACTEPTFATERFRPPAKCSRRQDRLRVRRPRSARQPPPAGETRAFPNDDLLRRRGAASSATGAGETRIRMTFDDFRNGTTSAAITTEPLG